MKIRNIFLVFSLISICFISQIKEVSAYEFPQNSYFIKLVESNLGEITVYFPTNQVQSLSYEEGDTTFINVSSGTVYGYFIYQNTEYRITCPTFDKPYYRLNGTGYQNTDLNIISIIDTNINFISDDSLSLLNEQTYKNISLFVSLGGVMVLCLILFKR